jgi:hypothetical protein
VAADNYIPKSDFRPIRLGVYGGMGLSWLKPKTIDYEGDGIRFTYYYGLLLDFNFTQNYTFSTGININSIGGKLIYDDSIIVSGTLTSGEMARKYRANYIEIPTMLKLKTNQMGYFTYFAQLGLRHGFRLNSYANDEFTYGNSTDLKEDLDMKDDISFYRLSFSFSVGAEYAISQSFSAFAYIGYDNGLTDALSGKNRQTGTKEQGFFKKMDLTVGFLF